MDRTCTLCNVTINGSEFRWQSHLASDQHLQKALRASHDHLLQELKGLVLVVEKYAPQTQQAVRILLETAREAIAEGEAVEGSLPS